MYCPNQNILRSKEAIVNNYLVVQRKELQQKKTRVHSVYLVFGATCSMSSINTSSLSHSSGQPAVCLECFLNLPFICILPFPKAVLSLCHLENNTVLLVELLAFQFSPLIYPMGSCQINLVELHLLKHSLPQDPFMTSYCLPNKLKILQHGV